MTTQTATGPGTPIRSGHRGLFGAPAAAGIAFVVAWLTDLAVWPSNVDVSASGGGGLGVHRTSSCCDDPEPPGRGPGGDCPRGRRDRVGRAASRRGAERLGRAVVLAGIGAAIVSLVECALGLVLASAAVPDGESGRARSLFHLINRLDGAQMLALAAMALAAVALASRGGPLPRWLGCVAASLAAAIITSGIGYLVLNNTLAQTAGVSLPLLLIWVAATGVTLGRGTAQAG